MNYDAALDTAQTAVETAFNEYDRALRDHADKKSRLKLEEARAYAKSQGTVEARKHYITEVTADLMHETNLAEAIEKSARSALEVARDRVSVLQTRSKLNQPVAF